VIFASMSTIGMGRGVGVLTWRELGRRTVRESGKEGRSIGRGLS
jgi:hypothetical protein